MLSSVFFFKQKTAYEMRISDWSSDVCSSDLDKFGADDIQRDGFRRQNIGVVQLADDQRTDAQRIAATDHAFGGQADQRIGALHLLQRVDKAIEQGAITGRRVQRSEEHTSELQSLMRNSYAVFCLKKKKKEYN